MYNGIVSKESLFFSERIFFYKRYFFCCCGKSIAQNPPDIQALHQRLQKATTDTARFWAVNALTRYYIYHGNSTDSITYYSAEELSLAESIKKDTNLLVAYNVLAVFFSNKAEYNTALELYLKALHIAETNKWITSQTFLLNNVSTVYGLIENYTQSLYYLRKAQQTVELVNSTYPILPVYVYRNIGSVFISLNQPDSALKYIQLANEKGLRLKDDYVQSFVLLDFAQLYDTLGNYSLADAYYKQAIQYSDSVKEMGPYADATAGYAASLLKRHNITDAMPYAALCFNVSKETENNADLLKAADILYHCYSQLNRQDSALHYLAAKDAVRDSIFDERKRNELVTTIFNQQLQEREQQAAELNAAHERSQNIQYAIIAIAVITLATLFALFSNSIANQKVVAFSASSACLLRLSSSTS